jgi:hypothetical protein
MPSVPGHSKLTEGQRWQLQESDAAHQQHQQQQAWEQEHQQTIAQLNELHAQGALTPAEYAQSLEAAAAVAAEAAGEAHVGDKGDAQRIISSALMLVSLECYNGR